MNEGLLAGVWVTPKLLITEKSHPNMNDNILIAAQMEPPSAKLPHSI